MAIRAVPFMFTENRWIRIGEASDVILTLKDEDLFVACKYGDAVIFEIKPIVEFDVNNDNCIQFIDATFARYALYFEGDPSSFVLQLFNDFKTLQNHVSKQSLDQFYPLIKLKLCFATTKHSIGENATIYPLETSASAKAFTCVFEEELGKYPFAVWKILKNLSIYVGSKIKVDEINVDGFTLFNHGILFGMIADRNHLRRVIHHELFHMLEFSIAEIKKFSRLHFDLQTNWLKCNPATFKYFNENANENVQVFSETSNDIFDRTFFVSAHSMRSIHEDMAEIFAYSMTTASEIKASTKISAKSHLLSSFLFKAFQHKLY